MDLRLAAYITSGVIAAASFVPVTVFRHPDANAGAVPVAPQPSSGGSARAAAEVSVRQLSAVAEMVEKLRVYESDSPEPRLPGRNPFRFSPRAAPQLAPAEPRIIERAEPPPAPPPMLKLVGMAERVIDGNLIRTAVVSGLGDVYLVAAGDVIRDRFTVLSIGADAMELRDERSAAVLRLTLH